MEENNISNRSKRSYERRHKRAVSPITASLIILMLIALSIIGVFVFYSFMPNREVISPREFHDLGDRTLLVFEDNNIFEGSSAIIRDGVVFLPSDYIAENIDRHFFWEEASNRLTITNQVEVVRITPGTNVFTINNIEAVLDTPFFTYNGLIYAPQDFLLDRYSIKIGFSSEHNIVFINSLYDERTEAVISSETELRYEPNRRSVIAQKLPVGDIVTLFELSENERYRRVRSSEGIIGYVSVNSLGNFTVIEPLTRVIPQRRPLEKPIDGRIILAWDLITVPAANRNEARFIVHPGVNVISPTWFSFYLSDAGDISMVAMPDRDYVQFAHDNDWQVWALISDNYDWDISHAVLSNALVRDYTINRLIHYVIEYNLDGINVDFERVSVANGPLLTQFIRELAVPLHALGRSLSVCLFVPMPWYMQYDRTEIGKVADFIAVMTYDEHYSGSPNPGPVASIGFVQQGISRTLDEVPSERVLMGLPFYIRVWREEILPTGEIQSSNVAWGMQRTRNFFIEGGADFAWMPDIGKYYAEFTTTVYGNQVTYMAWIEDERSIATKLELVDRYDLAGVAAWRRGLEMDGIWEVIAGIRE
ncbi:MAG: glycosyl hydrolase family 18 protein [Defluviitaleaceae bacterium]|nr:glycosyl hydrolase family 18 protein [Defluviitaleaceae bacterium]